MTATSASSAAPRNALRFWAIGNDIFVEIPNSSPLLGPPSTILRFPFGPVGLSKALTLLGAQPYDFAGTPHVPPSGLPAPPKDPILADILRRRGFIP